MKPSQVLDANRAAIRGVVEAHRGRNARVFGSVLRGEDVEDSDLDILIDPTPETTLFDIGAICYKLEKLLGVPVDVLTPDGLTQHHKGSRSAAACPARWGRKSSLTEGPFRKKLSQVCPTGKRCVRCRWRARPPGACLRMESWDLTSISSASGNPRSAA
ncbi:nucleotidyltransferase family protein [Ottowia sp.]|uniref:nucleotidyltransferase family protein n=1 Tax=Ottowia sp. TaxID=1898956 RepID=UPI0039E3B101